MNGPEYGKRLTLRRLCELAGEAYMDVPLEINVRDAAGNTEFCALTEDWPNKCEPFENYQGRVLLTAHIDKLMRARRKAYPRAPARMEG